MHSRCLNCPFGGQKAKNRGNPESPIVIVGESLGVNEMHLGIPFVGNAGQVLWSAVPGGDGSGKDGIEVDNGCYTTNAIQCFPRGVKANKDTDPRFIQALQSCHDRLIYDIMEHPRKIIIALGNPAIRSLTGLQNLKITQIRGMPIPSPYAEYGIIPAVHPAALLRGTDSYRVFKNDVRYAFKIAATGEFKKPITPEVVVAENEEDVQYICSQLEGRSHIASDYETSGFNPRKDYPLSLGLAVDPERVFIVPGPLINCLKPFINDPNRGKMIWHFGKFDVAWGRKEGLNLTVDEDTLLQSYTIDESPGIHDLERLSGDLLGAPDWKHKIKQWVKKKSDSYALIPPDVLYNYQGADVSNTLQNWRIQNEEINEIPAAKKLYNQTLLPLSELLSQVEDKGMLVDQERVTELGDRYVGDFKAYQTTGDIKGGELYELEQKINEIAGYKINPNSPQQLSELLFDKLKLESYRKNDRSTDKDVLRHMLEKPDCHPIVKALQSYRKGGKSFSTYVKGIWQFSNVYEIDGSIHTVFMIHGTRTGRLSSRNPNLQNIPRDPMIRGCFVSRPGYVFLEVDLNQAELRCLAQLSKDVFLTQLFNDNTRNLHDEMSEQLFPGWNTRKDEWQGKEERMRAKTVNFGVPYGREAGSIAEDYGVTVRQAQKWIDDWFKTAPQAREYLLRCARAATHAETITTVFGRRKHHFLATKENIKDLISEAKNFPHQSIASDINCHNGMALQLPNYPRRVKRQLYEFGAYIVNLVHDSLLIECPDDRATIIEVARIASENAPQVARQWGQLRVPFIADCKVGTRWGSLIPLEKYLEAA